MLICDFVSSPNFPKEAEHFGKWLYDTIGEAAYEMPLFLQWELFEAWSEQDAKSIGEYLLFFTEEVYSSGKNKTNICSALPGRKEGHCRTDKFPKTI